MNRIDSTALITLLKSNIKQLCRDFPSVIAVYVFGSFAKGTGSDESDLDVALLAEEPSSNFPVLQFQMALEDITGRSVDLVLLNRAGEVLKYHVRRDGLLVYEKEARARKMFEVRSRKYFEDFQYIHRKYVDKVLYGKE